MAKLAERVAELEKELEELKRDFGFLVKAHGGSRSDAHAAYDHLAKKHQGSQQ